MRNEKAFLEGVDGVRAKLDRHRPFTPEQSERLTKWFLPRFLYCSSSIGVKDALTGREVAAYLERQIVSGGHHIDKFLGVERHHKALEAIEKRAQEGGELDKEFVKALHWLYLDGSRLLPKDVPVGDWKTKASPPTRRRGHVFRYVTAEEVDEKIDRLFGELLLKRKEEHPVKAAAWFLFHFHLIHPFQVANGPISRLVTACLLLNHGYPPLIIPPDEVGNYLDALTGVDLTVVAKERVALSPKYDLSSLLEFMCTSLVRTGERQLDVVTGKRLSTRTFNRAVLADQAQLMTSFMTRKNMSWRVRATAEIRNLHSRILDVVKPMEVDGDLFNITLERAEVLPSHAASRMLVPALPTAEAGLLGEIELLIQAEQTARGLRYPDPVRLIIATISTNYGLHILVAKNPDERPRSHSGPARSPEWPTATLEQIITKSMNEERKAFQESLNNLNSSRSQRYKLIRAQLQSKVDSRNEEVASGFETLDGSQPEPAPKPDPAPSPREQQEQRSPSGRIDGLSPSEPPLSF